MASLGKSFVWLFLAEFLFYVSGYVVHMGAGRILGVEDYGRYTLVITITILLANLIGAGLPIAMGKFLSATIARRDFSQVLVIKRKIAWWQMLSMMGVGGVFFLSSHQIALLLGDVSLGPLFAFASLIIPLYGADLYYFHYYSGLKRFEIQSWLKFARSLLRMSFILALAYWFHIEGMIAGYITVPLLVFVLAWFLDRKLKIEEGDKNQDEERKKETMPFSFRSVVSLAGSTILFLVLFEILVSFDLYVLKYITGSDVLVGDYGAALTVARIPTFLFYALTLILLPTISEARILKDEYRAKNLISLALRYMFFLSLPMVVILSMFSLPVVTMLFGSSFFGASVILPQLVFSMAFLTILYVFGFAFIGAGKSMIPVWIGLSALFFNGILILFFLKNQMTPMEALLLSKNMVAFFVGLGVLLFVYREFESKLSFRDVLVTCILGIFLFGVTLFIRQFHGGTIPTISMLFYTPLLFIFYVGGLILFRCIGKEDIRLIRERV